MLLLHYKYPIIEFRHIIFDPTELIAYFTDGNKWGINLTRTSSILSIDASLVGIDEVRCEFCQVKVTTSLISVLDISP